MRTLRRECLDPILPLSECHVRSLLAEFVTYDNVDRPHRSLGLETPVSESQQVLFRCFEMAFRAAGGVPVAILVDDMKSAMMEHRSDEIVFHPAFRAFAEHWGFEPIAAMPGRGQTVALHVLDPCSDAHNAVLTLLPRPVSGSRT